MWKEVDKAKLRVAAKHATAIQVAMKHSVNIEKVIDDFFHAHPLPTITAEQAQSWAEDNVHFYKDPFQKVYEKMYADGWVFGTDVARSALVRAKVNKAYFSVETMKAVQAVNWATWKAGNRAAAELLHPPIGLHRLMASRGVAIQGIGKTTTNRIGTALAMAINEGLSPSSAVINIIYPMREEIARRMKTDVGDVLADPIRALMIAQTEMSRAVSIASRDQYETSGVEYVEWLVAEGCDICQENEDEGPIPIDATFPSGDSEPPAHPYCMCSLSPYVVDTQDVADQLESGSNDGSDSAGADMTSEDLSVAVQDSVQSNVGDIARSPSWAAKDYEAILSGQGVLDADARFAAQEWQGNGYRQIQGSLSGGSPSGEIKETISILDRNMISLEDFTPELYRGQTEGLENLKVGDKFKSKLFQSSTSDPIQAAGFSKSSGNVLSGVKEGESATILRIDASDAKGFAVPSSSEYEVILARGSTFTVDRISEEEIQGVKMRIIDVTAVSK